MVPHGGNILYYVWRDEMAMDNRELMTFARAQLRGEWGVAAAVFLVYLVLSFLPGAIPVVGWIGGFLIAGPLMVGLHIFSLSIARSQVHAAGQLFEGFSSFTNGLVAYILATIFIMLWTLLLIVPGIMAAFSYSMTFFVLADNRQLDGLEAIRRSKAMMYGNRWRLSCLIGRFTWWILLGMLTLGIGFLWIGPYLMVSVAKFYEELRGAEEPAQQACRELTPAG
jgi:uncharacterized membrane protein